MSNNNKLIHITTETRDLLAVLTKCQSIIARKSALPILNDVLLSYKDGKFTMTGHHADGHRLTLDAPLNLIESPEKQFQVCLPVADLLPAVKVLPQGGMLQLFIDQEARTLRVTYITGGDQQGEFSLPIAAADEFPQAKTLTEKDTVCAISVPSEWLLPRIKAARVAVANDELRPVMNCVCIDVTDDGGAVTVVATDGHTLIRDKYNVGIGSPETPLRAGQPATMLLHSSVLSTFCDVFQQAERISMATDGRTIFATAEGVSLQANSIDGRYPNYNSVIPQNNDKELTVEVRELTAALKRVGLFANDSSNMCILTASGDTLRIEASDYDFSKAAEETVRLQQSNLAAPLRIGFKISSLLAMLGVVRTENVVLKLSDPSRAMLLFDEDVKSGLLCLLMPMLVNEN